MARGKQTIHEPEIIPMLKTVEQILYRINSIENFASFQ